MTITTTAYKVTVAGNGGTTIFPYEFEIPGVSSTDQEFAQLTFVDASGNSTVIPASQWSITGVNDGLNNSQSGNFTYPLTGSPIAVGTTLTLERMVPIEQLTSLKNQGNLFPQAVEQALDFLTMALQQVSGLFSRALVAPVTDATPPAPIPSATARANQLLGFDGSGNPIAAQPSSALVSTPMQPVVSAASLAVARTAMGLGATAVENIGKGLEDDGAGNLQVLFAPVSDSVSQSVTAGFHTTQRQATGALTYTIPAVNTLFSGFSFSVFALTDAITFAIDASDAFNGMPTGTSLIIPAGTYATISTDGVTTLFVSGVQQTGLNAPLNLQLSASVLSNALTIAIKDRSGNDPSKSSPVLLSFRDPTVTNGDPVLHAITSAISITVPNGATLGTINNGPSRVYFGLFDNAGTLVPWVWNSVIYTGGNPTGVAPLNEAVDQSGVSISTGSDNPATFYSGATITAKALRVLGYIDFDAGQSTAGTWANAPSRVVLASPGIPRPGNILQSQFMTTTSNTTSNSTSVFEATAVTVSITPISTQNLIKLFACGTISSAAGGGASSQLALLRGGSQIGVVTTYLNGGTVAASTPISASFVDNPGSVSAQTYAVGIRGQSNSTNATFPTTAGGFMQADEIMV